MKRQYTTCRPPKSYTGVFLSEGQYISENTGKMNILKKFGQDPQKLIDEGVQLLFAVDNHSYSGELAETFVFFVDKHGNSFEVWGSECSVWDFDGQWEPEPVVVQAWLQAMEDDHGMGMSDLDHSDLWRSKFLNALDQLFPYFDAASQQDLLNCSDALKKHMPIVSAYQLNNTMSSQIDDTNKPTQKKKTI